MNCTVVLDWKFVVAVGVATTSIIFAVKMDAAVLKRCQPMRLTLARNMQLPQLVAASPAQTSGHAVFGLHAFFIG